MILGVTGAFLAICCYLIGLGHDAELASLDERFRIRGTKDPPASVAIVAIDSATLTKLNEYPLPRRMHAKVIDRLRKAGVAQISYDIQFSEETTFRDDTALIEAINRTPHVVLATTEVDPYGRTHVLGGDNVVKEVGAVVANGQFPRDADGAFRRVDQALQSIPSFSVATVEARTGRAVTSKDFPEGSTWIDYLGPANTFATYSFVDVLDGKVPAKSLRGKTVVVGATAETLQDIHPTPFDAGMPGPEIQANAVATVLTANPLRSASMAVDIAIILLLSVIATYLFIALSAIRALACAVTAGAVYLVGTQIAFNTGIILPVLYPELGLVVVSSGGFGVSYLFTSFDRTRTRDEFARFVPSPVVDRLLDSGGATRLGGEYADATVLFADLRGFTSFAESKSPAEVVTHLNSYLDGMTMAIMEHGGTLVCFMGDGIMAVFGAPIAQEDHADRALAAAIEMLETRLPRFNAGLPPGSTPFEMGIGLNSGPVLSGLVGSSTRTEYTAIGDTTNTASRLESMTKGTPHQLFISDATRQALPDDSRGRLVFVDEMDVRGRKVTVRVWSTRPTSAPGDAD